MRKTKTWAVLALATTLLVGCAHPELVDIGDTRQAVLDRLGAPEAATPMPDGTVRWTYSDQPFGQGAWWVFVGPDGKVARREQALVAANFKGLRIGKDTEKEVFAYWGRYAELQEYHLWGEHAWMYRFVDDTGQAMAVWPQFDKAGVLRSLDVTMDPWVGNDLNDWD